MDLPNSIFTGSSVMVDLVPSMPQDLSNFVQDFPQLLLPMDDSDSKVVKCELKKAIQDKKIAKGEEMPTVEYREPPLPLPKLPEKPEDLKIKREKNKIAAKKCRENRKRRCSILGKQRDRLEDKNSTLFGVVQELRKEKEHLTNRMAEHFCMLETTSQSSNMIDVVALVQQSGTVAADCFYTACSSYSQSQSRF